jgi:hypothetical protein
MSLGRAIATADMADEAGWFGDGLPDRHLDQVTSLVDAVAASILTPLGASSFQEGKGGVVRRSSNRLKFGYRLTLGRGI